MHQTLRRHRAFGHLAAGAHPVLQVDPLAPCQRATDGLEVPGRDRPPGRRHHLDAANQIAGLRVAGAQHAVELVQQRLKVPGQHAPLVQAADQLVHRQQRMDLAFGEPQAGQFVPHLALVASVRVEAVAVGEAVVDDGRVHALAQVFQVALQRGTTHAQLVHQVGERHAAPGADQQLDLVEALGTVHGGSQDEPPC